MAKSPRRLNVQETILHNELIYLDQTVEINLLEGPSNRVVNWKLIARTIPVIDEGHGLLRGFPDGT